MRKINLAIFFGGHSSEYEVSLASAYAVVSNLDKERYVPVLVGISADGQWHYFHGDLDKVRDNAWLNEKDCVPAALCPNYGSRKLLLLKQEGVTELPIDAAFPVLHGKFGEDGTLQGMIEMAGIPLVGCDVLSSALCMDKDRAHKLAAVAGVLAPRALVLEREDGRYLERMTAFVEEIGLPVFVKPLKAGSSFGVSKVSGLDDLEAAAKLAFTYDSQMIVEETIEGFEVGCAVLGTGALTVGEVDEIELSGGFFDYTEKYTLKTSKIHVPARISQEKAKEIKDAAKAVYKALGCSGFARVDLFLTPDGEIVFNEVNTIPGFTEHSRYPGMMKAAGIPFGELLTRIIEQAVGQ